LCFQETLLVNEISGERHYLFIIYLLHIHEESKYETSVANEVLSYRGIRSFCDLAFKCQLLTFTEVLDSSDINMAMA